jgi:hypothetical protein
MGFVVCHIQKPKGNDARTSAHIERQVHPANADQLREHLNERLVEYPDGVKDRTQAITHRIENAGITRKIGTNQVRALQVMLSGTHEDMQHIEEAGRLDEWCADNLKWLRDTFGADNVVAAELHRDEQTPHIHATVVPIVTGERRKAKEKKAEQGKRTYRKRPVNAARLCADDVMTRENLERFQDTYAEAMVKYGLQRGIRGSEARHIATPQYYRDLHAKNKDLREDIADLEERKQEVNDKIRDMYDHRDGAKEEFLLLDEHNKQKTNEVSAIEARLEQLKRDYEPYRAQEDLNLLIDIMPHLVEHLRIARLCKGVGLPTDTIKTLFSGQPITYTGKLHSAEHDRSFDVRDAKLQITKERSDPNNQSGKYHLSLNGQSILDWFREQFQKFRQVVRPYARPPIQFKQGKSRGI